MDRVSIHGLNDPIEQHDVMSYALDDLIYVSYLEPNGNPPYTAIIRSEIRGRNDNSVKFASLESDDLIQLTLKVHKLYNEKQDQWRAQLQAT